MTAQYLLFIIAGVCFLVAAFGVSTGRVSALPLGLLFWLMAERL